VGVAVRQQRFPWYPARNDSWISNSSMLEETERELLIEHGWEHLPMSPHSTNTEYHAALHLLVLDGPGPFVFDTIEIAASNMDSGERDALRQKVNQIFELHDCPWRISDGEFFKRNGLCRAASRGVVSNQKPVGQNVSECFSALLAWWPTALVR
jgi:hypothetical protein